MLVSILIPCFNAERWVAQAIESALAQTWQEKEVIVVDDGSTDSSLKIIQSFGNRIRWETGPNRGGNVARNRLLELARGEWLQYLDADDLLFPQKLASQLTMLAQCGDEVDVVCSPVVARQGDNPRHDRVIEIKYQDPGLNFIDWGAYQTTGLLFRRDALQQVGGWKDNQPCCQEHELLLRMMIAGNTFLITSSPGSIYRCHDGGSVSRKDVATVIRTRMELTNRFIEHLKSIGNLTNAHRKALFVARMEAARSMYSSDPEYARELSTQAATLGTHWGTLSPALPLRYQAAHFLFGFRGAERLATLIRPR